jgi:hypothetical protein
MIIKFIETQFFDDCKSLQVDTVAVQLWCGENCMKFDIQKIK